MATEAVAATTRIESRLPTSFFVALWKTPATLVSLGHLIDEDDDKGEVEEEEEVEKHLVGGEGCH